MNADSRSGMVQVANRSTAHLFLWTLIWVATLALATFGPSQLWDKQQAVSWAAVGINLAAGVGWIISHSRYLRGIDELQRKIMLDALAVTLGAGYVIGFAYVVAEQADLMGHDSAVGILSVMMGVVYMVAVAAGNLRYR